MQITQIEAIKSQIAFQGNQMASEALRKLWLRWGRGSRNRIMLFEAFSA